MEAFETELKNKNRGYLRLIVWQKAMQLFELTHRLYRSAVFPDRERGRFLFSDLVHESTRGSILGAGGVLQFGLLLVRFRPDFSTHHHALVCRRI